MLVLSIRSLCQSVWIYDFIHHLEGCQSYVSNAVSNPQIIQVRSYYNDLYYICGDGFAHENADVVCRENEGTTSLSYSNVPNSDLTSDFQFLRKRFKCTGKELTLCDCYTSYEPCPSSSAVKLKCNTPGLFIMKL